MARTRKAQTKAVVIIAESVRDAEHYAALRGLGDSDFVALTTRTKDNEGVEASRILVTPAMRTNPARPGLLAIARGTIATTPAPTTDDDTDTELDLDD